MSELTVSLRSERLASGDCRHLIDGDLRAGRLTAPFRGAHVAGGELRLSDRWRAACRVQRGDGWLSHRSAAGANGLPWLPRTWLEPAACVDLTLPPGVRRRQRDGLRLFWHPLPVTPTLIDGLPVTPTGRTLLDLLRDGVVSWELGVQLIDGALHAGLCSLDDLHATLTGIAGSHGTRRAAAAVAAARSGVESPGETRIRLALIAGGVPAAGLTIPLRIHDADGLLLARGDFGDEDLLLWGEYDGFDVHTRQDVFRKDRARQRWLDGRGWQVLRYVGADAEHPRRIAREWLAAAAAAPARILAMDPDRSPEVAAAQRKIRAKRASRRTRSPQT